MGISRNCFEGSFKVFAPSAQDTAWPYALARGVPSETSRGTTISWAQNVGIGKLVGFIKAVLSTPEGVEVVLLARLKFNIQNVPFFPRRENVSGFKECSECNVMSDPELFPGGTLCRSGNDFTAQLRVGREHAMEANQM